MLDNGFREVRKHEHVLAALRVAHPSMIEDSSLSLMTPEQVRAFRDELAKILKASILSSVVDTVKVALATTNPDPSGTSAPAAAPEPEASPAPAGAPSPEASPEATPDASAEATPAEASDAAAAAPEASAEASEEAIVPASENAAQSAEASEEAIVPASEKAAPSKTTRFDPAALEKLDEQLRPFRRNEDVAAALRTAAPSLTEEDSLTVLTDEQLQVLVEDLMRREKNAIDALPQPRPRALVRAMQALYLAPSCDDASLNLQPFTADEEAVKQLEERSQEFAPALAGMRAMAVDYEIFKSMADKLDEEEGEDEEMSEAENRAGEDDIYFQCKLEEKAPAPVVLPPGWRLEWVKRKKREAKEFIDPDGNRYYNVKEVKKALAALQPVKPLSGSNGTGGGEQKRMRLMGKSKVPKEPAPGASGLEQAFQDALGSMLEEVPPAPTVMLPAPRARVKLHSLQGRPELNGKVGRLIRLNEESGRWECMLEKPHGKVNVKVAFFTVLSGGTPAPAPAPVLPAASQEPYEGARIVFKGLVGRPELNGKVGRLMSFKEADGRWECYCGKDIGFVNVKPANFTLTSQAAPTQDAGAKRPPAAETKAEGRRVRSKTADATSAAAAAGGGGSESD
eukprot:gnl/TRDRNA2_/TRDRNA2_131294_c0_seq1.p1 gnl/TRDRNA2_/TRDRNA2_131294_c0~~gnl/TRDRNA2_/TRDRNA2_131294_c0_seq1.p1  ORF type:complete len:654 (-),score=180.41 gnl/TRDRNA2_/TRDRNA2_131294_c0_seq1:113-1987(-)